MRPSQLTPAMEALIRANWHRPVSDICALTGLSERTLGRYTAQLGLRRRDPGRVEAILTALRGGEPVARVAARFGVTSAAISNLAKYHGFLARRSRQPK